MGLTQIVPPAVEPISLAEVKTHLRVDGSDEDDLLTVQVIAARTAIEDYIHRQLVCATWKLTLDAFPADRIVCQYPPLISVSSITYVDSAGTTQTMTSTDYVVYKDTVPGHIGLAYGLSWPTARSQPEGVTVTYKSGYLSAFTAVAGTDLLTWVNRTPVDTEQIAVSNRDGVLPAPLTVGTAYYVRDAAGQDCSLALASGGVVIDIATAGTGTQYIGTLPEPLKAALKLMVADLYEHREGHLDYKVEANPAIVSLLWPYRVLSF